MFNRKYIDSVMVDFPASHVKGLREGTLPETNSLPLKMMVSKSGISELPGGPYFQVQTVGLPEGNPYRFVCPSRVAILTLKCRGFWNVDYNAGGVGGLRADRL